MLRGLTAYALETLLQHQMRDRILEASEVKFVFIEHDGTNVRTLRSRVEALGDLPRKVKVTITADDCYSQVEGILTHLQNEKKQIAPAFVFVDPYGFKVPGALLRRLLAAGRVELFVNVIWRELDMAIALAQSGPEGGMADTLDLVFNGDRWRNLIRTDNADLRADNTVDMLRDTYGARWVTSIRMLGENGATRYILAHFTNHDDGRDLMKECLWKICPDGQFYARRSDNPNQTQLIEPEPDLVPLQTWLQERLKSGPKRWSDLKVELRAQLWRGSHLSQVIRRLRKNEALVATGYEGRFSEKADPLLSLAEGM